METAIEKVLRLINRLEPEPICSDCIAEYVHAIGSELDEITLELAASADIERTMGECVLCRARKKVVSTKSG